MDISERRKGTSKIVNRCKKYVSDVTDPRQVGGCKTKHPWDCGDPKCLLCSNRRLVLGDTLQEIKSQIDFDEQIREI